MRRKDREITDFATIVSFIDECEIVRIGLADGDFPYIVPMNFAYTVEGEKINLYIHGAKAGRKFDLLSQNPYCSFEMDIALKLDCMPEQKSVTTRYKSVMGKAKATLLEGREKEQAMDNVFMARNEQTRNFAYDKAMLSMTAMWRLEVLELTAKANLAPAEKKE